MSYLLRRRLDAFQQWNDIRRLFRNGGRGCWYEAQPKGRSYRGSDAALTVSANGQTVGIMLDGSKGFDPLPPISINGGFDTDTGWTKGAGWSIADGKATCAGGSAALQANPDPIVTGKAYFAQMTITDYVSGSVTTPYSGSSFATVTGGVGTFSRVFVATSARVMIVPIALFGSIDNVIVQELPGYPALQETFANLPLYKAGPSRIDYVDGTDVLVTNFGTSLGADCTVARAVPGVGASILTGQTIGTTYSDTTDYSALIIIDRALTGAEAAYVTRYLNRIAFMG